MKELSIEEKAKRYDEALEIARQYWNDRAMPIGTNFKIERMFPELKESEDDRIRKELLNYLYDVHDDDEERARWIGWLKKQDKQNTADEIGNYDHKEVLQTIINEQTSANETPYPETLEKAIDLYYYSYGNGKGEFEHFSLEKFRDIVHIFVSDYGQKSAWSEEDELYIRELEGLVKRVWAIAEHENDKDTIHKMSDLSFFLKTLNPQLKQEWSEEEIEKAAQEWDSKANFKPFCMTPTGVKQNITTHKESFKAGINWILKSLRHQSTWKPSDEQIKVLEFFIPYVTQCSVVLQKSKDTLLSLLSDLKKL